MTDTWALIYDLRGDAEHIHNVQEASVKRPGYGFPTDPYLFGSSDWWSAVDNGAIELRRVEGIISAVYWGSMGDWPEFRVRTDDGSERTWTREGDLTRYVEGLRARIDYVTLDRKADHAVPTLGPTADVTVSIWIEQSDERTPLYKGYRGSREPDPDAVRKVHSFRPSSLDQG